MVQLVNMLQMEATVPVQEPEAVLTILPDLNQVVDHRHYPMALLVKVHPDSVLNPTAKTLKSPSVSVDIVLALIQVLLVPGIQLGMDLDTAMVAIMDMVEVEVIMDLEATVEELDTEMTMALR